ncbi:hypothetical protein PYR74_09915 [Acinetobacter bereziniae]|uniref:hypothetical protein n=1 Tax=Acinetobacter bereziniae TaxID=106648 RepID=UPI001580C8CD|nr:hypothetical protein [Acinetobacter bereziniae]NUF61578.1 hypothetical protein [Acinetobacter bereziniae]NUG08911.1 hypothetical protein [Acinetobacter bereziniae]NUG62339.1 hypothetical protein [Acinetobacter bereziniae]NUG70599.1 hypothetical protein [Acinetobacter bereziniae]NUG80815.1 hypothetical protein [Acinetobacter bereziniae]
MKDFYCPHCEQGIDRDEIYDQVHEDNHVGEWEIVCPNCKKDFELQAEASIDYWVHVKEEKEEG